MFDIDETTIYPTCGRKEWRTLYDKYGPSSVSVEDWMRFFNGGDTSESWWVPIVLTCVNRPSKPDITVVDQPYDSVEDHWYWNLSPTGYVVSGLAVGVVIFLMIFLSIMGIVDPLILFLMVMTYLPMYT